VAAVVRLYTLLYIMYPIPTRTHAENGGGTQDSVCVMLSNKQYATSHCLLTLLCMCVCMYVCMYVHGGHGDNYYAARKGVVVRVYRLYRVVVLLFFFPLSAVTPADRV